MNEDVEKRIMREDQKAGKIFAIIIVCAILVGGGIGVLSVMFRNTFADDFAGTVQAIIYLIAPYASLVITMVFAAIVVVLYTQSKNLYATYQDDDDEIMNKIEYKLSIACMFANIDMVFAYFFFAAGVAAVNVEDPYDVMCMVRIIMTFVGLVVTLVFVTVAQKQIVNFEKRMNPEKAGSIYDFNFQKKWEKSCDEAEKLLIYKASATAFKTTNMTCIVIWLFCVIGMWVWDFGLIPIAVVSIIWFVSIFSYSIKSIQLTKH